MPEENNTTNYNVSFGRGNTGQVAVGSNINQVSGDPGAGTAGHEAPLPEAVAAQRRRLVGALERGFSLDELQQLCVALAVNYENIPGQTLSGKAVGLVDYLTRRDRLDELEAAVRQERPGLLD